MSWTEPITFYDGDPFTSAQWNTFVRDNLNATSPGIATTAGRLIVTAGKHRLAERQWVRAYEGTTVTCNSQWPADPNEESSPGPSVTFEHGGQFLALYDCQMRPRGGAGLLNYSPVIEGDSENSPEPYEAGVRGNLTTFYMRTGNYHWFTGVTPGVSTVTMKYGSTPGPDGSTEWGDFSRRRLTVIPF